MNDGSLSCLPVRGSFDEGMRKSRTEVAFTVNRLQLTKEGQRLE